VVLLVVRARATLDAVETAVQEAWPEITGPIEEEELAAVRRELASRLSIRGSGVLGHARRCAAVAAGAIIWRLPSELEMEALMLPPESAEEVLEGIRDWQTLEVTGAGVLPISELEE
jgi:hypothetical protein